MSEQEMKQKKAGRGSLAPVRPRRDYKDTLFRMLFNDREALLSLYNAVGNTDYRDSSLLQIVTLENAVYMNVKNDLAFLLGFELNLYEHQSTWNPNMPLRDLFYISRLLEKYVNSESLYASTQVKIPEPHFIIFYNGSSAAPEYTTLRLSDAFMERKNGSQEKKEPELELKVRFLNINQGHNPELMKKCRTLREYSEFVARIRKYMTGEIAIEDAVDRAVTECIAEGILADFLRNQRAEVIAVSIFEYNEKEELKKYGRAEYRNGKAESVILALEMKGPVSEYLKDRIFEEKDVSLLEDWMRAAIKADSIEAFIEKAGIK